MKRHNILVNSITYAIKGRDLLRKHGVKAHIEKKTNFNGSAGCGYVIVAEGNKQIISNILINSGIRFSDINSIA